MATEPVPRDHVWVAVLRALRESQSRTIRAREVKKHLSSDISHMSRKRVMWAMTDLGVLTHAQGGHDWYAGPVYDELCG